MGDWEAIRKRVLGLDGLRVLLVLVQGGMVCQTWPLWNVRLVYAPNLPLFSWIPQVDMRWLMLATLVAVLASPRIGIPVHVGVLVAALAMDQMRLQPEFVSIAILIVATGPWRLAPTLGRAHLASLWLWAGFAKATSLGFPAIAHIVADNLGVHSLWRLALWGVPMAEMGLGVCVIIPATRRWAGLFGAFFHLSAVFILRMGLDWAIMPWNLGVAIGAIYLLLLQPGDRPALFTTDRRRTALVAAMLIYPVLVYVGLLDLYLGHHVYSNDNTGAVVCERNGVCSGDSPGLTDAAVRAIIPPERRVFEQWFRKTCMPGQTLKLTGRAFRPPLDHAFGTADSTLACPKAARH